MSTTIDSLVIDIQSSSSNAVAGIESLAASLEKMKKSTITSTAVKNLNALTDALKKMTTVSSNANKISSLADAMEKLKNVGSVGTGVKKLVESLHALKNVDYASLSRVAESSPLFERIGGALGKLSAVKAGGFGTLVKSLEKLDQVTAGLDDGSINRFAERVAKLNTVLGPLATKCTTIKAAFSGINATAKSAAGGVKTLHTEVKIGVLNMSNLVIVLQGVANALRPVVQLMARVIGEAMEWDGIEYQFGNAFGEQADMYYEKITKITEALKINTQTFMENSAMATSMLKGFGVGSEDARKMGIGYTELAYDIWAAYNNVYKSLDGADGAMAAVRSAIAGEVEPIRRAGFTIVESQLAITAANHGLAYSSDKATEAQKSYLRYLTLVEQAHTKGIVGTYASEMDTAEGLTRTLTQQIKSLSQAFGSLFLPILVRIMPWLQAFVDLLTDAVIAVANFFGVDIQKVDWSNGFAGMGDAAEDAANGINDATKAAKDLQKATLGIDELNIISPTDASGSGAGGQGGYAGLDVESLWDESVYGQIQSQVDEIKEKLKDWLPVIETIGTALGALGLVSLIKGIGEALGKMEVLQKVLASVAIVTLEAVLVFSFADDYLESGNVLNLVGEAVATAIGSYLLYKAWGKNGLAIGIAVSLAMQLAAITFNLADGGVSMSDPELWIQSAFTTATGAVGGGLLAWKGLLKIGTGQGVVFGALAALSLTLASITFGNAADGDLGWTEAITGALSAIIGGGAGAALFTFLGIATGGTGFLVGAGIMLAVNVIGALIASVSASAKDSLEANLNDHFGNVELSIEEMRVIIGKLIPEWSAGVNQAAALREDVANLLKNIEAGEGTMGAYEWQIGVGLTLSESENSGYRAAIDQFIVRCQDYVSERGYALEIGLKATTSNEFIIESANAISAMAGNELETLGKSLQETVNAAYEDGLLDIDELEAIQNIRNDMREIVNALASSEIEAEFDILKMNWSGVELTPESFTNMMSEWNKTIKETVKPALEATVKENLKTLEGNVAFAKLELEKDPANAAAKQMLADAEASLQAYLADNPLEKLTIEAHIEAVTFAINTLQEAFAKEIAHVEEAGYFDFNKNKDFAIKAYPGVVFDEGNGNVYGNWDIVTQVLQNEMSNAADSMSTTARKNLEKLVEAMKPTMADIESIAAENRKAGKTVPQSVREGINDYNELLALTGDLDGINYLIGQNFTTDPVFLNTLATVKGAGATITGALREGFLNNVNYVTDEASGLIVGIKDAVTGKTTALTPTMAKNLSDMGVKLGDALGGKYQYVYDETTGLLQSIVDSTTGNSVWVNSELKKAGEGAGKDLNAGLKLGVENSKDKNTLGKTVKDWAGNILDWARGVLQIHSPSKATEEMGKNLSAGLSAGMVLNTIKDKLSSMWTKAKDWWKGKSALETAKVGVSLVKKGWTSVKGWIGSIPGVSQAVKLAKSGWSSVSKWIGSLPKISQSVGLVKSGWTSVKNWVGTIPSLSAKIKLLKDGWSSVKSWLGGLDFKLNFKLPKIGVNWGEKTVLGFKISYPNGFYTYAKGGFPDMGEMFIAREAGPEMVGKIGSRTTVANNEQIVEGISEGVYAAVLAAMRASESNGNRAVNVYLDGKQITASVEKRQRERGATVMGNQVFSY